MCIFIDSDAYYNIRIVIKKLKNVIVNDKIVN